MANPILWATKGCCGRLKNGLDEKGKLNTSAKIFTFTAIFDAGVIIAGVVLGALGMVHIIPMPAIAAYSLFGVSGAVTLGWIISAAASKGNTVRMTIKCIKFALKCGDDPKVGKKV